MSTELTIYSDLSVGIKNRVRQGQIKAYVAVNTELLATYWDIGKMIYERQQKEGWAKGVIPRLAVDLKNELSEMKGFSERNMRAMVLFYTEYQLLTIGQLPVAKLGTTNKSISPSLMSELEKPYCESFKYELTRILPEKFKGSLPSVEEIENKLNKMGL